MTYQPDPTNITPADPAYWGYGDPATIPAMRRSTDEEAIRLANGFREDAGMEPFVEPSA